MHFDFIFDQCTIVRYLNNIEDMILFSFKLTYLSFLFSLSPSLFSLSLSLAHFLFLFLSLLGCDLGDVGCSDRHAFQRLVRGPFKSALTLAEESRIKGVPDHIKHAVNFSL